MLVLQLVAVVIEGLTVGFICQKLAKLLNSLYGCGRTSSRDTKLTLEKSDEAVIIFQSLHQILHLRSVNVSNKDLLIRLGKDILRDLHHLVILAVDLSDESVHCVSFNVCNALGNNELILRNLICGYGGSGGAVGGIGILVGACVGVTSHKQSGKRQKHRNNCKY